MVSVAGILSVTLGTLGTFDIRSMNMYKEALAMLVSHYSWAVENVQLLCVQQQQWWWCVGGQAEY